jgi:transposase
MASACATLISRMPGASSARPVHVKTLRSQMLRMLLTHRKLLQSKAIAVENDLRATLRNFGLKVGMVGTAKYEIRIKELGENFPDLMLLVEPLLVVRRVLREQINILHRRVLAVVRDDEVCQRLMTVPGVGPVVALTYRATVDVPARFRKSKSVDEPVGYEDRDDAVAQGGIERPCSPGGGGGCRFKSCQRHRHGTCSRLAAGLTSRVRLFDLIRF